MKLSRLVHDRLNLAAAQVLGKEFEFTIAGVAICRDRVEMYRDIDQ